MFNQKRHCIKVDFKPAFIFLSVSFLLLVLIGCDKTPDEEQIKQNIHTMTSAIGAGKFADIAPYLHADFRASNGMNAQQAKQMLMMYGMQHKKNSITVVSTQTVMNAVYTDKAETTLSVITTGVSNGGLPNGGSMRVVKLEWRKDGDWKVVKADWQE